MSAPRIIPAGPMRHGDILPLIREVGSLRERGEYGIAAELEERIRQPLTLGDRKLAPQDGGWRWWTEECSHESVMASVVAGSWQTVLTVYSDPHGTQISVCGWGPTLAAALSDAHARYQAAIADTLLRMSGLLREVVL